MPVELLDPVRDTRWAQLVQVLPSASIYHHPAWLALLERQYRYPMVAPCVVRDGRVVAGVPVAQVASRLTGRRAVALPFSDECPLLVADPGDRPALVEALATAAASGPPLELRAPVEDLPGGRVEVEHVRHVLTLDRPAPRLEREVVRPAALRGARRAARLGVQVAAETSPAALDAFYRLHLRTRRRQGVPTQPKAFMDALGGLFARDLGFVLLARHAGRPVAAAVFLRLHGTLTYKYGASDERRLELRPNNLLFLEAIRWGCAAGLERLDLGRSELANSGLRAFKAGWGAREEPLPYTRVGAVRASGKGRAGRALAAIIRAGPPVAGRLLGAALYRHVG